MKISRPLFLAASSALLLLFAESGFGQNTTYPATCLNIAPGENTAELNFAWQTTAPGKAEVRIVKASGKAVFATGAKTFVGAQSKVTATVFNGDDKSAATGSFADKVTVTGLAESTDYLYRYGDGKSWSEPAPVSTRNPKEFVFFVVGDPQIGAKSTGAKTIDGDRAGWVDTINKAVAQDPSASFLISLGDEVNDYNKKETQDAEYLAYFSPAQLKSLPVATINGNHDFQLGEYYGFHYNQPHQSATYGTSYGNDGDYWFTYGDAVFLMLNSNTESVATHDLFLRETLAKNPKAVWKIVCFHHSIYSEADHVNDPDIIDRRTNYGPIFDRYHIDLVLQGHDHAYTRTFPIKGGKPLKDEGLDATGTLADPQGTVYVTFDSASGSKFYDWKDAAPALYSAARWQGKVPSFGTIALAGGKLTLTEYRTDDLSVIDSVSISKSK